VRRARCRSELSQRAYQNGQEAADLPD